MTTITIAHRLATIRRADTTIYRERGRLLAEGTFEEVRNQCASDPEPLPLATAQLHASLPDFRVESVSRLTQVLGQMRALPTQPRLSHRRSCPA